MRDPDCECDSGPAVQAVVNRIEELEAKLKHNKKRMLLIAGDKINLVSELAGVKGKLEKAIALAEEAFEFNSDGDDYIEWSSIWERIKELKGETDGC
jgi:hypothetical protein